MEISSAGQQTYMAVMPQTQQSDDSKTCKNASPKVILIPVNKDMLTLHNKHKVKPPEIGFFRLATGRLTKEQVAQVNKSRKLPHNAKFFPDPINPGSFRIGNKMANIRTGTQILPEGYELKRDWMGFTKVLPEGTTSVFLKNDDENN